MPSDCPICLEELGPPEEVYYLPCATCNYNFCNTCVEEFLRSSKDDYQEASDGSNQVKVHIACPQCRSKYPMDLADVMLLRQAHKLALAIFDFETGKVMDDSELAATQLAQKRDFGASVAQKTNVELAHATFCKVQQKRIQDQEAIRHNLDQAKIKWSRIFEGLLADGAGKAQQGPSGGNSSSASRGGSDLEEKMDVDLSLFMGLEECMGESEQAFVTSLMTSGDKERLSQGAMILNGILKLSLTGSSNLGQKTPKKLTLTQQQKDLEVKERLKKAFPLPNHMPGYFTMQVFAKNKKFVQFQDIQWNGAMTPPQKMARVWAQIYEDYDLPKEPKPCVAIQGVRGLGGRIGLRKGDIITHVNDFEWTGTAHELESFIWEADAKNPGQEITLVVNANSETASFLQYRHKMLIRSRVAPR